MTFKMQIMEIIDKYKAYYSVRAKKYEGNGRYKNTYNAEMKLSQAMQACSTLEDFRDRLGDLNELCAIALIRDQYIMESEHFGKHQEKVRKKEAELVLEKIDSCVNVSDVMKLVSDVSSQISVEISMDESQADAFLGKLHLLEQYLVYSNAEVPEMYQHIIRENAGEKLIELIESMQTVEKNNSAWQQQWKVNPDVCFEHRHFRHCPISAEHLQELRNLYKTIVQR